MVMIAVNQTLIANDSYNITWIENLKRSINALSMHFLAPLSTFDFSYQCLFSKEDYCALEGSTKTIYRSERIEETSNDQDSSQNQSLKQMFTRAYHYLLDTFSHRSGNHGSSSSSRSMSLPSSGYVLPIAQLVACTAVLVYCLIKNVKSILEIKVNREIVQA